MDIVEVSTPSRLCLFGEHQDCLGLEVIASVINLRFHAKATKLMDNLLCVKIRDRSVGRLSLLLRAH